MITTMSFPTTRATAGPAAAGWLVELVDVLAERRRVLVTAALALSGAGILAALLLPGFVPPRPVVGAAVGVAAVLLAVAIAVAADSADAIVRGARHVRAAGGQVAAVVAADPTPEAAAELAGRIDARAGAGGRHWVALAPAAADLGGSVSDWADALGVALAALDRRVVVIDLGRGPTPGVPGVVEVVTDQLKLGRAVDFDRELMLARLGPGADDVQALQLLTGLVPRLPSDIELLVVALPPLGRPGALAAAGTLDRVLLLAAAGRTSRVDLIASLDAIDATDTASEVVLIDPDAGVGPAPAHTAVASADEPSTAAPSDDGPYAEGAYAEDPYVPAESLAGDGYATDAYARDAYAESAPADTTAVPDDVPSTPSADMLPAAPDDRPSIAPFEPPTSGRAPADPRPADPRPADVGPTAADTSTGHAGLPSLDDLTAPHRSDPDATDRIAPIGRAPADDRRHDASADDRRHDASGDDRRNDAYTRDRGNDAAADAGDDRDHLDARDHGDHRAGNGLGGAREADPWAWPPAGPEVDPAESLRTTAALQTLAQEIWTRDAGS